MTPLKGFVFMVGFLVKVRERSWLNKEKWNNHFTHNVVIK